MNQPDYLEALIARYPNTTTNLRDLNRLLRSHTVRAIDTLLEEAFRCQVEHGFDATAAEDIALMHSELSEALEDMRTGAWRATYDTTPGKELKPLGVPSELADILIRVFAFARKHKIDLADMLVRKMLYNETRPFKHGGKAL